MKSFIKGLSKFALCLTVVFMTLSIGLATESPRNYVYAAEGDVTVDATTFPDTTFRQWVLDNITGGSTTLTADMITNTTAITVISKNIADLKGIEYFTALTWLNCSLNKLTTLDVSKNSELEYLYCSINELSALDVSKNPELQYLHCYINNLKALDVSNNTALAVLSCDRNNLTALDVSNNTKLARLECYSNQLTTLYVSNNTKLTYLDCDSNQLTALDVSNNTALAVLSCDSNQLTALDVSNNPLLEKLSCAINQLTALDVSNNTELTDLYCGSNQLTALDVSNNPLLEKLSCYSNKLTALDLSENTALNSANIKLNLDLENKPVNQTPVFVAKKVSNKYVVNLKQNDAALNAVNISELISNGTYDKEAATITYDSKPDTTEKITYQYDTGVRDAESLKVVGSITIDNGTVTNTADNNGTLLYTMLIVISLIGVSGMVVYTKRKI